MAVELALTPDSRWDIDTDGLVRAARDAGFSALGIPAGRVNTEAAASFASAGLHCHELLALVIAEDETATVFSAQRLAEAAAVIGARWVNAVFRVGLTDETAKVIERCAAILAEAGAGMAVEFSPLGPVTSIRTGLEVVAAAGTDRAGLLIDTWHFFLGDSTWEDLAHVPLEQIAYIQFDDAPVPESDNLMRETMHRRVMPGDGVFELDRFASTLLDRGFDGVVSVEVLNRELRALPVPEFARRAYASSARYWS
ncbi:MULTISPECIES: sugar phosphate isomerase/epimerase family protein [Pseudofrankia]|uniref:sugar phosphate isomerase/epimerase family protein n=1 Tax=Pseudofrankia TaxID=2994363 RepID=UPI000234B79B|nr:MULTISPECIES: sugar phosphate isomerase/epimerase [Pseudofrankia]OHV29010.1 xylose isomerase [Pseudofrankia sp. EUN1h]